MPTEQGAESVPVDDRGEAARQRADELQQRRADLEAGLPSTAETAETARLRAGESRARSQRAHHAAAQRHRDAGDSHRRSAAAHEQAAMRTGDAVTGAHQDAAERHRAAAAVHDAAAVDQQHEAG